MGAKDGDQTGREGVGWLGVFSRAVIVQSHLLHRFLGTHPHLGESFFLTIIFSGKLSVVHLPKKKVFCPLEKQAYFS